MEALIEKWFRHGIAVNNWYGKITNDPDKYITDAKVLEWFKGYRKKDLTLYHIYHDCGKPYCITYDETGREHYPNHSEVSSKRFLSIFGESFREESEMILHDMDFHTLRGEDLLSTCNLPFADHLYATAWSELFANAEIFGGIESDSFKIKRKRLIKALKIMEDAMSSLNATVVN